MKLAAPAKINLALHITGQRPDAYHLIESLVVFADVADQISIESAETDCLTFSGPYGAMLSADPADNLVSKARDALRAATLLPCPPVAIHLEKNLPLSSGIGGGSADAAATLKGLNDHWQLGLSLADLCAIGANLGADVPMCLHGRPLIASGIGEIIEPVELPGLHLLLVNPGVAVSTPAIFKTLAKKDNKALPPMPLVSGEEAGPDLLLLTPTANVIPGSRSENRNPEVRNSEISSDGFLYQTSAASYQVPISGLRVSLRDPGMTSTGDRLHKLVSYFATTRNDLQPPALNLQPVIADAIAALEQSGALLARMSGSGATCFGIFADEEAKEHAGIAIRQAHPDWWIG